MFNVPKGYVLISEEALQSWGKLEELRDMCPVKIVETHSYVKVGEAHYMPSANGFTMACFKASDVPNGAAVYILKENYV